MNSTSATATAPRYDRLAHHFRCPWPREGCECVLVHGRYEMLSGHHPGLARSQTEVAGLYARAKRSNDMPAAAELVDLVYSEEIENAVIDKLVAVQRAPIYLSPHPAFANPDEADAGMRTGPTNALPYALSAKLVETIGGEIDVEIVQAARVGRTDMNRFQRFLWQPSFTGTVRTDRPYVLVDDVFTLGGTFAALQSYITSGGGTVAAVTALARKSGGTAPLAVTAETLTRLRKLFGIDIEHFWKEAIGHEISCLSDAEGAFLLDWARQRGPAAGAERILALRNRLAEVRSKGE